ncbi:MAG: laccase domain-containing protein [Candidatus Nanopelagicaceae bacterium]|jgi:YfiH family protein|nr:laccase domain-containing protein [Candidatus Nanopelagicaceae bacterium]
MPFIFTNRLGGVSKDPFTSANLGDHVGDEAASVLENRAQLESQIGMPIVFMNQVHGDTVVLVEEKTNTPTCDALITTERKLAVAVMVADCIPLLLKSDVAVAAVHVGRKGLMNGVARKTIDAMRDLGAEVIHSYIGPNICGSCYEVGADIFSEVVSKYPSSDSSSRTGKATLDLVSGLKTDLKDTVLLDLSSCVLEDKNSFSYRRDGITGRQAGVIWL